MTSIPDQAVERMVIGAILADPRVLRSVQEQAVPGDFHDMRLGDIYRGILQMVARREPVDYITVGDRLRSWGVEGIELQDLAAWVQSVPTVTNADYYASVVRAAAVRRDIAAIGSRLMNAEDPGPALSAALDDLRAVRDRNLTGAVETRMLRDVLDVPESEDAYDWLIPDVLERRDRLMLTGGEGSGKSTLLRQIAICAAAGVHPFRFHPIEPIRVVVVDSENSERQWRRAVRPLVDRAGSMMNAVDPRDQMALSCSERVIDITRAQDLGAIHKRIDEVRPDLVMIGPLYRLVGGKPVNGDDEIAPVLAALDSIRDRGVGMLIEAHAGHGSSKSGERDLRPRGSSALLGWPEFGLGLQVEVEIVQGNRVQKGRLKRWRGDRDGRPGIPHRLHRGHSWPWEAAW